ncbi:M23 family metallopeptidase [Mucilaginibacter sp. CAU 1740]|uniref:M23 family metallopeptidase n=1 Tax=Mucilaginibacter sp. CAU 1740 TaxID=3140365 RepID=UPI00325BF5D0
MKKYLLMGLVLCCFACSSHKGPLAIFQKLSPHDQYARHLADAGLANTALGSGWLSTSQTILAAPLKISLPYMEKGYFAADKATATAFDFDLKRGQKISVLITKKPVSFIIYADLMLNGETVAPADSTMISYEVKTGGNYILRLQPELLRGGEYTLTINIGPALHFPVSATGHPRIGGFWGEGRDEDTRKHEGIDIFAAKGTPAIAAEKGTVTNVGQNTLGGLVVFMRPEGRDYNLYYAHLDAQLVHNGQQVNTGDTLGLVGNTGNAKNTPSHLHFGIYTGGGAIDPLLFVKPQNENPPALTAPLNKLASMASYNDIPVTISAATRNSYKVIYPDNRSAFVNAAQVKPLLDLPETIRYRQPLYDAPDSNASQITELNTKDNVNVKGIFKGYQLIGFGDKTGWTKISSSKNTASK